jgi:hypothetical protein
MKHIAFNPRFVNKAGNDLIQGKIHTIRKNYDHWKHYEGKEVALFTWDGKPYQPGSKHKVFCTKKIVSVQEIVMQTGHESYKKGFIFSVRDNNGDDFSEYTYPAVREKMNLIAKNDGFKNESDMVEWFKNGTYKPGKMSILHFTDFRY